MPAVTQQMGIASVGTFHKRRGDQSLVGDDSRPEPLWMRFTGEDHDQRWGSTIGGVGYDLAPRMDGNLWSIQGGLDLFGYQRSDSRGRIGLFYTHTDASGTILGNTLAVDDNRSGRLSLKGDSLGGYWTDVDQRGRYLDLVVMHTWLKGRATATTGTSVDARGTALLASAETGAPLRLRRGWTLEPQAQIIWQRIAFDDRRDIYSTIDYRRFDAFTGRLGLRLEGDVVTSRTPWQAFVSADLWHNFSKSAVVRFNDTNVATALGGTSLEVRGGASVQLTSNVAAFGSVGHTLNLDDERRRSIDGTVGIRIRW